ncbi:MAG: NAD(P)-dependent alcohol dehydrogenase [Thermoanaerobaculia bacterium]|nr:NAD(P)-dependent alcohol dehydrogenase [Thermoanaerobaculia bacterium]
MPDEERPGVPSVMRGVLLPSFGDMGVLRLEEIAIPEPGPRDVLMRVHAASVNPRDWMIRAGTYPFRRTLPSRPFILGSDVAGVVVRTGSKVEGFLPGDEVLAMVPTSYGFGGYAEYVAVPAKALASKPSSVGFAAAAALPLAGLTALQAIRDRGRMRLGHRVVVVGASGGVGHYGVQIAKALGASTVVAVCSQDNASWVQDLGADRIVDYRSQPFPAALEDDEPFDLIFDSIGRHSLSTCRKIMSPRAAYVTTVPTPRILLDAVRTSVWPWGRTARIVLVASRGRDLGQLTSWMESGDLKSVIDHTAPLDGYAELLGHSRSLRTRGKNVFLVAEFHGTRTE